MTRTAVIQTAFPGDVILSLPLYRALKDLDPLSHLAGVVRPESACLLKNNPYIDDIIPYDKYGVEKGFNGIARMASRLRGYDRAVLVQRHFRSALVAFRAGIPIRIGYRTSAARFLYSVKKNYRSDVHEVQRCLDLIEVDNNIKKYNPKIYIDDETLADAATLLDENDVKNKFIAIAPGSIWFTKRYVHFPELIDLIHERFKLPVVLMGGVRDLELCSNITRTCSRHPINLAGRTSLLLSAAIISKSTLTIANDSAPGHIAAAVGTPVIAIFGPTVPAFGFAPYSENSVVLGLDGLYCRPCSRHGSDHCPQGHFRCMKELSPEKIISAAIAIKPLI
jgi:heptosyltransferase-2